MNANSNYMRNPSSENPNINYGNPYKNSGKNSNGKGRAFSNKDWNNYYGGGKKGDDELVSKPMFTNSKLENNGNPEGNFVKIEINPELEEKKNFKLTNIGEVPINNNQQNSLLAIKSLLVGKDPEKDTKNDEEKTNENKNNEFGVSMQNNNFNNNLNDNTNSLPWRSGAFFGEKGGGYKKDYYNKDYWNNRKNNYYFSSGKKYNKNKYSLYQPQSKRSNKFD